MIPTTCRPTKALDHLFEAERADNGETRRDQKQSMPGFDFTFSPH